MAVAAVLAGCSTGTHRHSQADSIRWAAEASATRPALQWRHHALPGKAPTQFDYARKEGRDAMEARAVASASLLRTQVRVEPQALGMLRFSWLVPALVTHADMAERDLDDSAVRIVLAFEGDRGKLSAKDAMLSELARALTGEELPYATLMYVWCNKRQAGEVITSPRTTRIRKIVVESGGGKLHQWLDYERDIAADFQKAFGEPPGALLGIALMSDTDNTRSQATAWYGPVRLVPPTDRPSAP